MSVLEEIKAEQKAMTRCCVTCRHSSPEAERHNHYKCNYHVRHKTNPITGEETKEGLVSCHQERASWYEYDGFLNELFGLHCGPNARFWAPKG